MTQAISTIPSGVRYYSGAEAHTRRAIEETAMSVFDGWSYEEITTPAIDYFALFELGMGAEAQHAFRFTDLDGRSLSVRPDVTSGVARAAATLFANRPRPLRFSYVAPIFHQQARSHAEWRRESTQIGCELIGRNSQAADLEVLLVACEILRRVGLDRSYVITLNEVEIFRGIADGLKLDATSRDELRQLIDRRNAVDLEAFLKPYARPDEACAFAQLVQLSGKREVFDRARRIITNERSLAGLNRLESLWRTIDSLGLSDRFEVDLGDVSRLEYYTGVTFTIYVEGAGVSMGSGGRYDDLLANFGKAEPAIGFVLNLDGLAQLLLAQGSESILPATSESEIVSLDNHSDVATVFCEVRRKRAEGQRLQINFGE